MLGYLNYFENECNFIVDTAYVIESGSEVTICSGKYQGKKAVYDKVNGVAVLAVEGEQLSNLQGIELEVDEKDVSKR